MDDIDIKIDTEEFKGYLQRHYNNKDTKQQYMDVVCRYIGCCGYEVTNAGISKFFSNDPKIQYSVVNNILNRAAIRALVNCMGLKDIDIPTEKGRKKKKQYKFIDKALIDRIIRDTDTKISVMVRLAFDTGLRLSELINLKRYNMDLAKLEVRGMGKGNKEFILSVSKDTAREVSIFLKTNNQEHPFHYKGIKHHNKKFWRELKEVCKPLGIENMHPHRIRHSLGHYLRVNKGWDLEQVREILRHEDISSTQIYATATKEEVKKKMKEEVFEDEIPKGNPDNRM